MQCFEATAMTRFEAAKEAVGLLLGILKDRNGFEQGPVL